MFRRNLLEYLLPFPERHGDAYHDHWAGLHGKWRWENCNTSIARLYDYVQHAGNVRSATSRRSLGSWIGTLFRFCAFFWPPKLSRNVNAFIRHGRGFYFADLVRIQHTARNVLQRCCRRSECGQDRVRWGVC